MLLENLHAAKFISLEVYKISALRHLFPEKLILWSQNTLIDDAVNIMQRRISLPPLCSKKASGI